MVFHRLSTNKSFVCSLRIAGPFPHELEHVHECAGQTNQAGKYDVFLLQVGISLKAFSKVSPLIASLSTPKPRASWFLLAFPLLVPSSKKNLAQVRRTSSEDPNESALRQLLSQPVLEIFSTLHRTVGLKHHPSAPRRALSLAQASEKIYLLEDRFFEAGRPTLARVLILKLFAPSQPG